MKRPLFSFKQSALLIFCTVHCILYPLTVSGIQKDAGNVGFQLLEEPTNPRLIAMGCAGTAQHGSGFIYYNPAQPLLSKQSYLYTEYGRYVQANLHQSSLEALYLYNKISFAIHTTMKTLTGLFRVNELGNLPNESVSSRWQSTQIALSIAYGGFSNIGIGFCVSGVQEQIFNYFAYAGTASFGAFYSPIPEQITLSFAVLNIGRSTPMKAGDDTKTFGKGERLPLTARCGAAYSFIFHEMNCAISADMCYRNVFNHEKSFSHRISERVTIPCGAEIYLLPAFAIRIGKRFNHPTEIVSAGLGYMVKPLTVDMSFVVPRLVTDNEIKWLTSITYMLKTKSNP